MRQKSRTYSRTILSTSSDGGGDEYKETLRKVINFQRGVEANLQGACPVGRRRGRFVSAPMRRRSEKV